MEDYGKQFVKSIEEEMYKDRLDKVLSKFNLTYQGCGDLYIKIEDMFIEYYNKIFTIGYDKDNVFCPISHNHSLDTVEHLIKDIERG